MKYVIKKDMKIYDDRSEHIDYNFAGYPIYAGQKDFSSENTYEHYASHWHNDIELLAIISGEMNYNINGQVITLKEGQGIFTNSKQIHYGYYNGVSDCRYSYVLINPLILCPSNYIEENFVLPVLTNSAFDFCLLDRREKWQSDVLDGISEIEKLSKDESEIMHIQILVFQIWENIYNYFRRFRNNKESAISGLSSLRDMIGYIQKNYKEKITLSQIAEAGNVCKSSCCAIFNKYLKQTAGQYLTIYRLDKSINLLKDTDMSITDICYEVGLTGASYYSELFKKYFNCSPTQYRRRFQMQINQE